MTGIGKTFRSKIDWWIFLVLALVLLTQLLAFARVIPGHVSGSPAKIAIAIILSAVSLLILTILLRTVYRVDRKELRIYCGPFWWTVKIADIESVAETRSPLSSPALSLDRIRINYGERRSVMVSPADKQGFYAAIGHTPSPGLQ